VPSTLSKTELEGCRQLTLGAKLKEVGGMKKIIGLKTPKNFLARCEGKEVLIKVMQT